MRLSRGRELIAAAAAAWHYSLHARRARVTVAPGAGPGRGAGRAVRGRGRDPTAAGGTHARTWLLETVNPRREMVLREYPEADDAAAREARVLAMLDGLGGLAPRLLAADAGGTWSGRPSVLISRLPGQADITPADPRRWAAQLGTTLARIHRAPLPSLAGLPDVIGRPGGSPGHLAGPAAAIVAAAWPQLARAPRVLTHFDFWSGNTLWEHAALSGVVDWCGAAAGPASTSAGAAWTFTCCSARTSRMSSWPLTARPPRLPCPTRRCTTCGPSPARTTASKGGCPTTATSAGAT